MLIGWFSAPTVPNLKALTWKMASRRTKMWKSVTGWVSVHIFNELQGPLPVSWTWGRTRWIISMKLKLIGQVVTPVESHMSMDGRTDRQMDQPCHTMIRDFRQAYENCNPLHEVCGISNHRWIPFTKSELMRKAFLYHDITMNNDTDVLSCTILTCQFM